MDNSNKNAFDLLLEQIRQIVREEIAAANIVTNNTATDPLLTPDETAVLMGVNVRWLYRHANKLPFTRRISRKKLRFSKAGLDRWIAAKKPPSSR